MLALSAPYVLAREDEEARIEAVAKVKSFTDEQLRQTLEKLLDDPNFHRYLFTNPASVKSCSVGAGRGRRFSTANWSC